MWSRLRPGRREKQHLVLTPDDIIPSGFTRTLGGDGPVFNPAPDEQAATS